MNARKLLLALVLLPVLGIILMMTNNRSETPVAADEGPTQVAGTLRTDFKVVAHDVSPRLDEVDLNALPPIAGDIAALLDMPSGLEGPLGPQDADGALQTVYPTGADLLIPTPLVSFDAQPNIAGFSPPDTVGDVGFDQYVAMSNVHTEIFDKSGNSLLGPIPNNAFWAGFGGGCQNDNAGDPVVLHDQLSDRWYVTQFTSPNSSPYYICLAVSTTSDATGSYYRWAVSMGNNFPDYPKYGIWPDGFYMSTRDFLNAGSFSGLGAWAIDRQDLIAGDPNPTIISFLVSPAAAGGAYNIGDGFLPSDLDGYTLPPAGSPNYFVGSMDNGGPYGAPQDALTIWEFDADFATPANSTFTLEATVPIAAYDTQFPCSPSSRDCIPQPNTSQKVDILSYRQRPMHRLAYRNFGSYESLVTNQSVEASPGIAGMRWWEIRDPNNNPTIYQEGTYAPGTADGIHRWMGSIAQDSAGNMALGYSASNSTIFPSVWYTGRLSSDPLGQMPQGEGSFVDGTGSQTGSSRWGDYTSMNIDPVDDCTFWFVGQYVPVTSSVGWQLRVGAFRFDACGSPDFTLGVDPNEVSACAPSTETVTVNVGQVAGFTDPVTLSANNVPIGVTTSFAPNPVTPPGSSTLTLNISGSASPGDYTIEVVGTAPTSSKTAELALTIYDAAPTAPTLVSPANGAVGQSITPTLEWNAVAQAASYTVQVATDAAFTNVVYSASNLAGTSHVVATPLNTNTTYYWRVMAENDCGMGVWSSVWSFTTEAAPGDCGVGTTPVVHYATDFESGANGWSTTGSTGPGTWALTTTNANSPVTSYLAQDYASVSDQRLISPPVALPAGNSSYTLAFYNEQVIEDGGSGCYDGGILEISTNGGTSWTQVPNSALLTQPYDGTVDSGFGNPLAGLEAWCGDPAPWTNNIVDLNSYAGQTVQFRFRLGTDSSVGRVPDGWYIDDVQVKSCEAATGATPTATTPATSIELSTLSSESRSGTPWLLLSMAGIVGLAGAAWLSRRRNA